MQWRPSAQYANMPHEEYLRTPEGQQYQQATSRWNDWMRQSVEQATRSSNAAGQARPQGDQFGPAPRSLPDPRQHVATGGQMSASGKPMAVYGPSSPLGGGYQRPQGLFAAGTPPEYMAANPDTLPYRPGGAQPSKPQSQGPAPLGGRGVMTPAQAFEASQFYNSAGQPFNASVDYLPGTSADDMRRSFAALANSQGYFQRPGQAQPKQPASQGMPYAKYGPGTAQEYMSQNPDTPQAPPKQPRSPASFTPGAGAGNLAYAAPENRPAPFQQRTTDWTGRQVDPQQGLAQRGAFVQSINQSRAGNAAQWGAGRQQAPTRNFGAMWGQAGDMAKQGWQNPLSGLFGQQAQGRRHSGFARDPNEPPPPPGVWY